MKTESVTIVDEKEFNEKKGELYDSLTTLDELLNDFERMTIFSNMIHQTFFLNRDISNYTTEQLENIYYKFNNDLQDLYKKLMKHNEKIYDSYFKLSNLF